MDMDRWSPVILTLVTFMPLAGALLLLLLPRRDRDIRVFSLVVSLLTFVLSLHLPVHFHRAQGGFQYELDHAWIPTPNIHYHMGVDGISHVAGAADHFSDSVVCADLLEIDS